MSEIKDFLEESELGALGKVFPALSVPAILENTATDYMRVIAEAAIQQVNFLNAFADVPLEVLYENIGQRNKSSNLALLSMLRKRAVDTGQIARGLDLVDVPEDGTPGLYSSVLLPAVQNAPELPTKINTGLLQKIVGLIPEMEGLVKIFALIEEWSTDSILVDIAMDAIHIILEAVLNYIVGKMLGIGENCLTKECCEQMQELIKEIIQQLKDLNYKTETLEVGGIRLALRGNIIHEQ